MTLIERHDAIGSMTSRNDDDRGIGESHVEITISIDDGHTVRDALRIDRHDRYRSASDVCQHRQLRSNPEPFGNEIVGFIQDERGEKDLLVRILEERANLLVLWVAPVGKSDERSRIQNQSHPRSCSWRSLISS